MIFKHIIPKKRKQFGIKIFKLCDLTGYRYDMKVYLGKDTQRMAQHVTATHQTVTELKRKIEGHGHKLYMDNFFSSPELFNDLAKKHNYCCGTVRLNRRRLATRPSAEDNKNETGRHSRKHWGSLDGNAVAGQERHLHVDEYS